MCQCVRECVNTLCVAECSDKDSEGTWTDQMEDSQLMRPIDNVIVSWGVGGEGGEPGLTLTFEGQSTQLDNYRTMADTDHRNRVVFLGAGRVGKTAILKRFLFNTFVPEYKETVEDLYARDYNIRGTLIKVDLLDTAGNLTFPAMRRLSITTAHAFVLVYSITSAESFTEVTRLWTQIQEERPNWKPVQKKVILGYGPSVRPGGGSRARTHDRRVPVDLLEDSLATVPPTPLNV
ncbi:GTP-binding protein di-ras2 [Plakobranchus ocellatus]|uniref:GTP-binding protein di-ras2 n=1 Tax=Plakobranchus ocellatus TaxID=259542 RepID=A0AAV4CMA7_9GAST|nr:GTP-binding protein di-ras2 [Plakobranchus ocellatus]